MIDLFFKTSSKPVYEEVQRPSPYQWIPWPLVICAALLCLVAAIFATGVETLTIVNDRTNDVLYRANRVEFRRNTHIGPNGDVIEGVFYEPFLNGESLGPRRASPGGVIRIELPPSGNFICPDDLQKELKDAKMLKIARILYLPNP